MAEVQKTGRVTFRKLANKFQQLFVAASDALHRAAWTELEHITPLNRAKAEVLN